MNKAPQRVQGIFDGLAHDYDKMNDIISLGTHRSWRTKTMAAIDVPKNGQILDVAAGTGDWTIALAKELGEPKFGGGRRNATLTAIAPMTVAKTRVLNFIFHSLLKFNLIPIILDHTL